jgi:hypothetical protein
MRPRPDHTAIARRYFNCAQGHIKGAEMSLNAGSRVYHVRVAAEYLSLAEMELRATRRHPAGAGGHTIIRKRRGEAQ